MKNVLLLILISISIRFSFGQATGANSIFNLGFERKAYSGTLPDKWFQWGQNYNVKTDSTTKRGGQFSVLIEPAHEKTSNSFGCVATAIPANYEAREIELRAYMKLEDVAGGPIGLMIRIDGNSGTLGFENMQGRNIQGTMDWTMFSVKIPYPENPNTIYVGAILSGTGKLWVDDFQILFDGKNISEAKIKKPKEYKADGDKEFDTGSQISPIILTKDKANDLQVLGQIWGFLKYYHPAVARGDHNWDYALFRILPDVLAAKNSSERNLILNNWITSLGKFEKGKTNNSQPKEPIKLSPELSWINRTTLGSELAESLNSIKDANRTGDNYYMERAINGVPEFKNEKAYRAMNYPDFGFRLLSLYRYWNIIQYCFPYKYLIHEDWNAILTEFLPGFLTAGNELEYKLAALSLISRVHDTHANIWGDNTIEHFKGDKFAPLEITFVENKAIVTNYFDKQLGEKTGLKRGDEIKFVDNRSVQEILNENLSLTPASNYATKLRDIARNLLRTNKSTLDVQYSNGTEQLSRQIETFYPYFFSNYEMVPKADSCFKLINPKVAYLYPGMIKNKYLPAIMPVIQNTKGLIIDLRCYPSEFIVFTLGGYLLAETKSFARFSANSITTPGLFTLGEPINVGYSNPDYYKGKIVIIINETTQSQAEYTTMALRTAPNATVIGSTTAGADGDVVKFMLPGGVNTMISGYGVYYPDGKETQRIGIVPDIEVKPTVRGVREGKDELLERAIKIIDGS